MMMGQDGESPTGRGRGIEVIGREMAAELLGREQSPPEHQSAMLDALDAGLIEPGRDLDGRLHWRATPAGLEVYQTLTTP